MVTLASLTNCECRQVAAISRLTSATSTTMTNTTAAKLNLKHRHFHRTNSKKFKRSQILTASEEELLRAPPTTTTNTPPLTNQQQQQQQQLKPQQQQQHPHLQLQQQQEMPDLVQFQLETDHNNNDNMNYPQASHDPVYLEDDQVFYNLILKESSEQERRQLMALSKRVAINRSSGGKTMFEEEEDEMMMMMTTATATTKQVVAVTETEHVLTGQMRHSLLSWMLKVCEHQVCQDDIFPLACMILDKFLLFHEPIFEKEPPQTTLIELSNQQDDIEQHHRHHHHHNHHHHHLDQSSNDSFDEEFFCEEEEELNQRQLYLFAACSLLLATKLRQTPRLSIQSLIEFSKYELPVELQRCEIQSGEILILSTLKWDLASLVTPNDFLSIVLGKCRHLLIKTSSSNNNNNNKEQQQDNNSGNSFKRKGSKAEVNLASATNKANLAKENDSAHEQNHNGNHHDNNNYDTTTNVPDGSTLAARCDELKIRRHIQSLLELCLMDSHLSQFPPSILAMASIAVAIGGMNSEETKTEKTCWRLTEIVTQIHEATHKINELKLMIDAAFEIEEYVQKMRDLMIEYSM